LPQREALKKVQKDGARKAELPSKTGNQKKNSLRLTAEVQEKERERTQVLGPQSGERENTKIGGGDNF